MYRCYVFILIFGISVFLVSCNLNESTMNQDNVISSHQETEQNQPSTQQVSDSGSEEKESLCLKYYTEVAIDYDLLINQGHEIVVENVLSVVAGNAKEHSLLKEALSMDIKMDLEAQKEFGTEPATMEYFVYDINSDGLEDYLVCCSGILFEGSRGNSFYIYVQEKNSLKRVFSVTAEIHYGENSHFPIAILSESNEGYHSFVLPWTKTIWNYCMEEEEYSNVIDYRD